MKKHFTVAVIGAGGKIKGFLDYPTDDGFLPTLHDKILDILG